MQCGTIWRAQISQYDCLPVDTISHKKNLLFSTQTGFPLHPLFCCKLQIPPWYSNTCRQTTAVSNLDWPSSGVKQGSVPWASTGSDVAKVPFTPRPPLGLSEVGMHTRSWRDTVPGTTHPRKFSTISEIVHPPRPLSLIGEKLPMKLHPSVPPTS